MSDVFSIEKICCCDCEFLTGFHCRSTDEMSGKPRNHNGRRGQEPDVEHECRWFAPKLQKVGG